MRSTPQRLRKKSGARLRSIGNVATGTAEAMEVEIRTTETTRESDFRSLKVCLSIARSAQSGCQVTSRTSAPVRRASSSGVVGKTARGVPAAAQIAVCSKRSRSMTTRIGKAWPTGGTPPIA